MLQELKALCPTILSCLDELDVLTKEPKALMDRLPGVRLKLTRASRARSVLLERTHGELFARAPDAQQVKLQTLRAEGTENLVNSIRHIGTWTLREIDKRWPDYCAASNRMRAEMRARVRKEAELIYPLVSDLIVVSSAAA